MTALGDPEPNDGHDENEKRHDHPDRLPVPRHRALEAHLGLHVTLHR
jgi:hypothetical protein